MPRRIIDTNPVRISTPHPDVAGQKSPSGTLLRTTKDFVDALVELGVLDPKIEGVHPNIQPVSIFSAPDQSILGDIDIDLSVGGANVAIPTINVYGGASPLFAEPLNYIRFEQCIGTLINNSALARNWTIKIIGTFNASDLALYLTSKSVASGNSLARAVCALPFNAYREFDLNASGAPYNVVDQKAVLEIDTRAFDRVRIEFSDVNNSDTDFRFKGSVTTYDKPQQL